MLGYTLKRQLNKKNIKNIYNNIMDLKYLKNFNIPHINFFYLLLPKRQHFFFFNFNKQFKHFSAGRIIATSKTVLKFYKKTNKANTSCIVFFQNKFKDLIFYIMCFIFKNYTMRHWVFFQKLISLVKPSFYWIIIKKSYNLNKQPIRRIKRRVLELLKKSK